MVDLSIYRQPAGAQPFDFYKPPSGNYNATMAMSLQSQAEAARLAGGLGEGIERGAGAIAQVANQKRQENAQFQMEMARLEREYALRRSMSGDELSNRLAVQGAQDAAAMQRTQAEIGGRADIEQQHINQYLLEQQIRQQAVQQKQEMAAHAYEMTTHALDEMPTYKTSMSEVMYPNQSDQEIIDTIRRTHPEFVGPEGDQEARKMLRTMKEPIEKPLISQPAKNALVADLVRRGIDPETAPNVVGTMTKGAWESALDAHNAVAARFKEQFGSEYPPVQRTQALAPPPTMPPEMMQDPNANLLQFNSKTAKDLDFGQIPDSAWERAIPDASKRRFVKQMLTADPAVTKDYIDSGDVHVLHDQAGFHVGARDHDLANILSEAIQGNPAFQQQILGRSTFGVVTPTSEEAKKVGEIKRRADAATAPAGPTTPPRPTDSAPSGNPLDDYLFRKP